MAAPLVEVGRRFLSASQLLIVIPGKRFWVPRESLFPDSPFSRENAHNNCYQPQDVVFIWLIFAEHREVG